MYSHTPRSTIPGLNATVRLFLLLLTLSGYPLAFAQDTPQGSLAGRVIDAETKEALPGANVQLSGTTLGSTTDMDGTYSIPSVPVGSYVVRCSYVGYEPILITDVIVKPARQGALNIEMRVLAIETQEITISPSVFSTVEAEPMAVTTMSYEEIRRGPASMGDVSRIIMALPSVAKVNDTRNNLIVRGGSPLENGYYIDGIPVPNINHYPSQGASSGAMGLVNVDFIEDVQFHSGGFGSEYGDKLSSITDITLREGSRERLSGQFDLSFTGVGGVAEGPLPRKNGSWMFSARRSYFDLVTEAFDVEASTAPFYSDFQTKLVWDLNSRNTLSFSDLAGFDVSRIDRADAQDNEENLYGRGNWDVNTAGLSWRCLWGKRGYSVTSLSHNYIGWDNLWKKTRSGDILLGKVATEQQFALRNAQYLRLGKSSSLEAGVEAALRQASYDNFWGASQDPFGNSTPALHVNDEIDMTQIAPFVSLRGNWLPGLTLTTGLRGDHSLYTDRTTLSPRTQIAYRLGPKTTISGSAGRFYQQLPLVLLSQKDAFKDLDDPYADHFILGFSQLLSEDTRLTVEAYDKEYSHLPLNPEQPLVSVIDQSADQEGFTSHERLVSSGKAYTRGVEVLVQKKLVEKLFGVVSGSVFRSRYEDLSGEWRDRAYDNQWMVSAEGGYKPNARWEFSARWVMAGGAPYTPFDVAASRAAGQGVLDSTRVNEERLPDYHSLNLRVDRRFHFRSSDLICYLNIWNVYGRENIAGYYWSEVINAEKSSKQWSVLPVIGLEYEF